MYKYMYLNLRRHVMLCANSPIFLGISATYHQKQINKFKFMYLQSEDNSVNRILAYYETKIKTIYMDFWFLYIPDLSHPIY